MARKQNDFHYHENHRYQDAKLHEPILADGDDEAAKKISDQVAREIGLTEAEIKALSAPPQKWKGKGK
jgi:hypothetical protein